MALRDGGGVTEPRLPPGRELELDGRGTTFIRELSGPSPDSPTVILLHGWTATADLNWFTSYYPLAQHYRVVALDHRGHGGGIRSRKLFRLADCADDIVALADALDIQQFIPVGYSMGGPIAQLVWKQHPDRVLGLVLCATAGSFASSREEKISFMGLTGLAALARLTPTQARQWITDQVYLQRKASLWEPWAVDEVARHDWRMVLEAGRAIGSFSSRAWLKDVDVPTSVVVTTRDRVVPTRRQMRLLESISQAKGFRVDGDHDACIANADLFVPSLLLACESVCQRSEVAA